MLVKATLRIRHAGCFSERLAGAAYVAQISGDARADVLLAHAEDEKSLAQVERAVVETHAEAPEAVMRTPTSVMLRTRHPAGGALDTIAAHGCAILWPALYRDGHETFQIVAPDRARLSRLVGALAKLGDARVEAVSDVNLESLDLALPVAELTEGLTARQLDALRLAIDRGYYDAPRRASAEELARAFGVSPSTFQEHLRKAERALLSRVGRALRTYPGLARGAKRGKGRPPKA